MKRQRAESWHLKRVVLGVLASLVLLGVAAPATSALDPTDFKEELRRATEELRSRGALQVGDRWLRSPETLPTIYEARQFRPLWTDTMNIEALLGEVAAAGGEGLNTADYHFEAVRGVLERRRSDPGNARLAAEAELLLTDALIRLAAHFYLGKVDPETGAARWDLGPRIRGEPAAAVVTRIATGSAVALQLGELRPVQPLYGRLKAALARYRVMEQEGGWDPLPPGRVLQLDMEDRRVPLLRQRLAQLGDFTLAPTDSLVFDQALEDALKRFQGRHGLEVDGLFGPASLRALNRTLEQRMDAVRVNLERARWLLSDVRGRFLVVDPAGRRVVLMDNSQPVLELPARFSAEVRNAAEFRGELTYFVVRPDWVLPDALVTSQFQAMVRRAPAEPARRGLEVFGPDDERLEPSHIDWSGASDLRVRQRPHELSFLGEFRFPLGGPAEIFLHEQPQAPDSMPGAVALDAVAALAQALLAAAEPVKTVESVLSGGESRTITFTRSLPVLYGPWSVWADIEGRVLHRPGFELRDEMILRGLRASPAEP